MAKCKELQYPLLSANSRLQESCRWNPCSPGKTTGIPRDSSRNTWLSVKSSGNFPKLSRCHIWQAFVQESIRSIAAASKIDLELQDGLSVDDVTKQAYSILGENGIIRAADQHSCKECTQPYKSTADIITGDDPAALVGVDENWNVPALVGEGAELAAEQARQTASHSASIADQEMADNNPNNSYITMVVVDGIVISPPVCNLYYWS